MRILQVIPSYLPATRYGGPIFSTHALAKALVERGNDVEVYTTYGGQDPKGGLPDSRSEIDGVIVNYFMPDRMPRLAWAPELGRKLKCEIQGFDIVHLHTVFLWPTWIAARHARAQGVPYIVSPRGMLVKELIERRNRIVKSLWNALIEKGNLQRSNAVHVTSTREAEDLAQLNWKLTTVANIPNGIEWSEPGGHVSLEVRDIARYQPYVLFFGRLSWKKGLDTLLHAFARTTSGCLIIAGTDDEGLSSSLHRLVRELDLAARVHIVARTVSGADKFHLFRLARAFVLPSYSENFGNTVLEAMASRVPVIVTPGVGAGEIVSRAKAGFIVDKSPEALAPVIEHLLTNEQDARRLGEAGREYVIRNCSWASVAAAMEQLYRDCMSSQSHRVPA